MKKQVSKKVITTEEQKLRKKLNKSSKLISKIKEYINCMNPKHCGCDRCPNCNIFYNKLKTLLEETLPQKERKR